MGKEVSFELPDGFHGFTQSVRPIVKMCLYDSFYNTNSYNQYWSKFLNNNVPIIPYKYVSTVNIGWGDWCSQSTIMRRVLPSLFPLWRLYTIRTLEFLKDMLPQTVFRASEEFPKVEPLLQWKKKIIMLCSTLTDPFCPLISLVELRQNWTSSQLPEREGMEATSPFRGQKRAEWGFTLIKNQSPLYLNQPIHLRSEIVVVRTRMNMVTHDDQMTPDKTPTSKLIRPRIELEPAVWEATTLPLDHRGGQCYGVIVFLCSMARCGLLLALQK